MTEPIGDEIRRERGRLGPEARAGELEAAWPEAVGEAIARNAWPARTTRDGRVVVHTADAVWAFELTQQAESIRQRLGAAAPRALTFVPGPLPATAEPAPPAPFDPPRPSADDDARAERLVASIGDPDLRETVKEAVRMSLARARSDRGF